MYLERATASVGLLKNEKLNVAPQITVNVVSVTLLNKNFPHPHLQFEYMTTEGNSLNKKVTNSKSCSSDF